MAEPVEIEILLTNDDGIGAPGLRALEDAFAAEGASVWVVAPSTERSTCGHGMTLGRPLSVEDTGPRRFAVYGTPADCIYWAMFSGLIPRPSAVVSGINRGANLGTDVIYSGTVAGAREAAMRGVHGIGVSLVDGDDYGPAAAAAAGLTLRLVRGPAVDAVLLNLNFPGSSFAGIRAGRLGRRIYPELVRTSRGADDGELEHWLGGPPVEDALEPGSDGWLISRGFASATPLTLDQTDHGRLRSPAWREQLGLESEG